MKRPSPRELVVVAPVTGGVAPRLQGGRQERARPEASGRRPRLDEGLAVADRDEVVEHHLEARIGRLQPLIDASGGPAGRATS